MKEKEKNDWLKEVEQKLEVKSQKSTNLRHAMSRFAETRKEVRELKKQD